MGKQTPAAPDYAGAAQQTSQGNRDLTEQQTWANRPNINTPFGQQTWEVAPTWDPTTGQYLNSWTQNTNLTPEAQSSLDSQMRIGQGRSDLAEDMLGGVSEQLGQPMDWSNFQSMGQTPGTPNYNPESIQRGIGTDGMQNVSSSDKYYNQAGDAIFNQWSSRNEPQFTKDNDAMRTQLYNQGLKEGDAAYDEGMRKLRESQTDARGQASYQATIGAGSEAQRMQGMDSSLRGQQFGERTTQGNFANSAASQALQQQLGIGGQQFGQNLQAAGFQNQGRQQQISEEMQRRGFSLNEINGLLSGQQVGMPSMPDFTNAGRSAGADYMGAAGAQYGAGLDSFNAQQQQMQGLGQGALSLAMMFSDRKLKKNIKYVGTFKGRYIYIWEWINGGHGFGVMADEVPEEYVAEVDGLKMVDYGRLFGVV